MSKATLSLMAAMAVVTGYLVDAHAFGGYLNSLNAKYGTSYSCTVCHIPPGTTARNLNVFAKNFANFDAATSVPGHSAYALDAAFEAWDSDGDGASNLTEFRAKTLPNDPNSRPAPPDTTPPTVSISAPANGATVSGTVTISANASDNVGVAGVQFRVDGANLGAEDTAAPYSVSWNTTAAANGSHTITAVARDAAGNTATSASVTVTVNNTVPPPPDTTPPTVSISAPANGATVSGTVTISANASDNVGVAGVQFRVDGANLGAEDTAAPYSVSWNTTAAANGSHTITAVARDAAGNTATSASVTVTVNNTAPPPQPTPAQDMSAWEDKWFRVTLKIDKDHQLADLGLLGAGRKTRAYLHVIAWDPNTELLETRLHQHDAQSDQTVSVSLPLNVLDGDYLAFTFWSQFLDDPTTAFTGRIKGKLKAKALVRGSFRTEGDYQADGAAGAPDDEEDLTDDALGFGESSDQGWLMMRGKMVPAGKVPSTITAP